MDKETGTWDRAKPGGATAQLLHMISLHPGSRRGAVGAVAFIYSPCEVEPGPVGRLEAGESDSWQGRSWASCAWLPERPSDCLLCLQVCERPPMFLLDTPGVLAPRIGSVETGLKLALCGELGLPSAMPPAGPVRGRLCARSPWPRLPLQPCPERPRPILLGRRGRVASWVLTGCLLPGTVLDHLVGEETLADYLLYTLNRHQLLG